MSVPYNGTRVISENLLGGELVGNWSRSFNSTGPRSVTSLQIIFSSIYGILFITGECGNLAVFTVVSCVLANPRCRTHVFLYILWLCLADALSLLFLPLTMVDILMDQWTFGAVLCKLHFASETMNKIMSPLLLTLLSFDRYVGVCHPVNFYSLRTLTFAWIAIGFLFVVSLLSMSPLLYYAHTSANPMDGRMVCEIGTPEMVLIYLVVFLFLAGFCVPALSITIFYGLIILRLRFHINMAIRNSSPLGNRRVTKMALFIVMFYFVCFAPYWLVTVIMPLFSSWQPSSIAQVYVQFFLHTLPYLNSAVNPILYAFLNKELQRCHMYAMRNNAFVSFMHDTAGRFFNFKWTRPSQSGEHEGARMSTVRRVSTTAWGFMGKRSLFTRTDSTRVQTRTPRSAQVGADNILPPMAETVAEIDCGTDENSQLLAPSGNAPDSRKLSEGNRRSTVEISTDQPAANSRIKFAQRLSLRLRKKSNPNSKTVNLSTTEGLLSSESQDTQNMKSQTNMESLL